MRLTYTDENLKTKVLTKIMNSTEFINFMKNNLSRMQKMSYGSMRMNSILTRVELNKFLKTYDLFITTEVTHAYNIGNNNLYYVQDLATQEYIACINLNEDPYGGMYCYATDIHSKRISNSYFLRDNLVRVEQTYIEWD